MISNFVGFLTTNSIVVPGEDGQLIEYDGLADSLATQQPTSPPVLIMVLCAALVVVCIALTVIILMQKKRASGIGAALSGTGETYWSKNKSKSPEGALEKYTKWGATLFILISLAINIFI